MKKVFVKFSALVLMASMIFACSAPADETTAESTEEPIESVELAGEEEEEEVVAEETEEAAEAEETAEVEETESEEEVAE